MIWLIALLTGLGGSLHCIGMCGPIMLALPGADSKTVYFSRFVYHSGRILMYALLGAVFGLFGWGLNMAGFQQTVSILAGIIIILMGLGFLHWKTPLPKFIAKAFQNNSKNSGLGAQFTLGVLNGLLPCGLVYIALAGAVASQTWYGGAGYMALFGLGTFPAMYLISILPKWVKANKMNWFKQVTPVLSIIIGGLFIVRGLGLGIPYLSPKADAMQHKMECCSPE